MMPHNPKNFVARIAGVLLCLCTALALANEGLVMTPRGAGVQDLKPGNGAVVDYGDVVTMHFVGWLDDAGRKGRELFNTRREHGPVSFVVGTDKVMPGWNEGVLGMRAGGKRLVRLPPELGYGARGVEDVVPANASLIFIIDVIAVETARH